MGEVTILHARESREFACEMAAALAAEGHSVFRRNADEPAEGAPYADAAIVIWSPGVISNSTAVEAARKALARRVLVPVAIGDIAPPSSFAHLWPIDLAGWQGDRDDPRWQFVRDEISLAMRRNEFAPPIAETRAPHAARSGPGFFSRAALPVLLGVGVLAAGAAVIAIFVIPSTEPALRTGGPTMTEAASLGRSSSPIETQPRYSGATETTSADIDDPALENAPQSLDGAVDPAMTSDLATVERPGEGLAQTDDDAAPEQTAGAIAPAPASETAVNESVLMQPAIPAAPDDDGDRAAKSLSAAEAPVDQAEAVLAEAAPSPDASSAGDAEQPAEEEQTAAETPPPLPAAAQDDFKGVVFRDCVDCPDMAEIEPGPAIASNGIEKISSLTFSAPFALSRREITFNEWRACMQAGGCRAYSPPDAGWGRGKRPVINVSYEDAKSYADWLSRQSGRRYRLPSEAEWAYAAHAGAAGGSLFGAPNPQKANYDGGPGARRKMTTPAGSFAPSAYGLYDMAGNVGEWVDDCAATTQAAASCPVRYVMGGAWDSPSSDIGAEARDTRPQSTRAPDIGFRVARDLP